MKLNQWTVSSLLAAMLVMPAASSFADVEVQPQPEFASIAVEYQKAVNTYNIDEFVKTRLADHLDLWMPLGIHIETPAQFKSYMLAMANMIGLGNGGAYHVDQPQVTERVYGGQDNVYSVGAMSEQVQFKGKASRSYSSNWVVHLQKQGGTWKVLGGVLQVDPKVFPQAEIDEYKAKIELAMAQKSQP